MKVIQYIKINHLFNRVAFASGVILTLLAIAIHLPIISNGEQETQAAGSSDPSITMTFTNSTASVDLAVNSANGTFAESTDATSAKFSVSTTSAAGYTLSISASDDTGNLVNGSETLTSISSAISSSTFDNASYNGKWGYKPSKLNSVANTNFIQSPTTEATTLDVTDSANNEANNYTIALGTRADYLQSTGEYSKNLVIEAVSNFTPITCDNTKLCVQYDGNGLTYEHGELVNNVNYNSSASQQEVTKILHSDNVNDSGIATGNSDINIDQTKEATIDGASSVNVSLYYDTEGEEYDWVTLYAGADSVPSSSNDETIGSNGNLTGKLGGNKSGYTTSYTTWNLWNNSENPINSDTIKIHFVTDDYADDEYISYGYYAVITGTGVINTRTVTSGEYTTPTGTNAIFHGWSSTQTTAGAGLPSDVEYTDESEVMSNMPGNEGESKTLYAVWQQGYSITFNKDSNVSSIAVLDSDGNTVGTITSSGQSLILYDRNTYTIKPTYTTGYTTNTITKTSGAGTLNGKEFTVGAGAATISVTSKVMQPMQNWTGCSSLAVGDTEQVYDTRDNEVYLVGKLADNKCWMLDNLRFDIVAHKNDISSTNTNITNSATLISLKSGNRDADDKYATAGVSYWGTNSIFSAPLIAIQGENEEGNEWDSNTTTTSYGSGSGKIGVYYNYCAASAGSYCYGDGTISTGTSSGDAEEDICPAGWRMPTGGSSGEYQALYAKYSGASEGQDAAFKNALSTPLSGSFYDGSASNQGSYGDFWSSTWDNDNYMYVLYMDSSDVYIQGTENRSAGLSVRCLLQMPARSITFNMDSNVSSIAVLDSTGDTVGTITSSGQSISLYEADTYTIQPTYAASYITDAITKTSGAGTLNGNEFTVGDGTATINITSRYVTPMQNWTGCSSLAVGDTEQVYDTRDNEVYLIGKLADNKCWMLDNLNLAGGTALSATDTDVDGSYISSFTTSNRLTKNGGTIVLPASSTSGFDTANYSYVYNSGNKANCGVNTPCYSYYSWDAATLGSGRTIGTANTDAPYSICPKGWRLPTAYSTSATNWQTASDFYVLAHQYGLDSTTSTSEYDNGFYTQAGPGTVPNFLLAGFYYHGSFYFGGSNGIYWSATSTSSTDTAHYLYFNSGYVSSDSGNYIRYYGFSVRCLLAE